MTLQQLRDKADAKLVIFWQWLVPKQNAYFAKHGKYFQLLISPENAVIDGVDSDFTNRVPDDEVYTIDRDFSFSEKVPFQLEVHEWVGPEGAGYKAIVWVQLPNGNIYTRSRDNMNNDSGWSKFVPNIT